MSTNIHHLPGTNVPEQSLVMESRRFDFCQHEKIALDEHERTVKCAACAKVFDPFNFLKAEVHRIQRAWEDHRQVRSTLNDLIARVQILKKEEARLKARIKTAKAKVEPVIDVRNRQL